MKITRRMEWPYIEKVGTFEEVSDLFKLLYQTLTEESALRAVELDVPYTDGYNVILGHEAGVSMAISLDDDEGVYNVFIGHQAGYSNTTGIKNIAIGYNALSANTSGHDNVAIGTNTLLANTTGIENIAIGADCLKANVGTGHGNTAIGYQALEKNTSGDNNLALGRYTLEEATIGSANVAIGGYAGAGITTGGANVFIGFLAGSQETTASNKLYIANSNTATPLIYGEFDNNILRINNRLTLGMTTEVLEFVDSGSSGATEQDWIEVQVGGNQGWLRVYAAK